MAQGKAPANDTFFPQMLPATFVVNNDGREACFCPLPEDTDGLYVLFFNQGTFHGSKKISTDAAQLGETVMLPVLFGPGNMSDAVLTTQMLRHMQAHNAVVVAVDCSKEVRNALCRAWQKTLPASEARCHQAHRIPAASVSYGVTDFRSEHLLRKQGPMRNFAAAGDCSPLLWAEMTLSQRLRAALLSLL